MADTTPARDWGLLVLGLAVAALAVVLGPTIAVATGVEAPIPLTALLYATIFLPMAAVALGLGMATRTRPAAGIARVRWSALGLALGIAGLLVAALYARLSGSAVDGQAASVSGALVAGVIIILFQVACEELFFRGWIQPLLTRLAGVAVAVAVTAVLFAGFHVLGGARAPLTLVNLLLGGLWFGLLAWHSRGVLAPIAAHFGWNASEQLLLGLDPNPGVGDFGSVIDWDLTGPTYWGGSDEGLNASIAMTVVLIAFIVPLAWQRVSAPAALAPHQPGREPV